VKPITCALGLLLLFTACRREIKLSPKYSVPLARGEVSLDHWLQNTTASSFNDTGVVVYHFDREIYSLGLADFVGIPDTTVVENLVFPLASYVANPGVTFLSQTDDFDYQGIDVSLTEMIARTGVFEYEIRSPFTEPTIVTFNMPAASLNGIPFSKSINVPAASSGGETVITGSEDLSNYIFDLTGVNGNQVNTFQTQLGVQLDPNANQMTVTDQDTVQAIFSIKSIVPEYVKGYFGNIDLSQDSSAVDIPGLPTNNGSYGISDIDLDIVIENGVGADVQLKIIELDGWNENNSHQLLIGGPIGQTINVTRANDWGNNNVGKTYQYMNFTWGNSNIVSWINNNPDSISYQVQGQLNPNGNSAAGNDFMYYDHPIKVSLSADIPLDIFANQFVLLDTLRLNSSAEIPEQLDSVYLRIECTNGFPFSAGLELSFEMNGSTVVKDLDTGIESGIIGSSGRVSSATVSYLSIAFSRDEYEAFLDNEYAILELVFSTYNAGQVKIYPEYKLSYKAVADINTEW
jgi:hypothetical protein